MEPVGLPGTSYAYDIAVASKSPISPVGHLLRVLAVLRTAEEERGRLLDLLTGWALGSTGQLDRIGPNSLLARPPGCGAVRLGRLSLVLAVEEAFAGGRPRPLSREEEERLLPMAVAGSADPAAG